MTERSGDWEEELSGRVAQLETVNRRQRRLWLFGALFALLVAGLPVRADVAQLIELQPGTPARASDINDNFRTVFNLASAADANASTAINDLRTRVIAKTGPIERGLVINGTDVTRLEVTPTTTASVHMVLNQGDWDRNDTRALIPVSSGVCMLAQTNIQETIANASSADSFSRQCTVYQSGGMWYVQARLTRNYHQYTDLTVTCQAHCLRWN